MTVYFTPYNPATLEATGPSADSGFSSVVEAVRILGEGYNSASERTATYPELQLAVTDYVLRVEPVA